MTLRHVTAVELVLRALGSHGNLLAAWELGPHTHNSNSGTGKLTVTNADSLPVVAISVAFKECGGLQSILVRAMLPVRWHHVVRLQKMFLRLHREAA